MTRTRAATAERDSFREFVNAVLALSDDPEPTNVERYLEASRALEETQRSRQTRPRARARSEGVRAVVQREERAARTV